jgi:putative dimethyl sulfoxide reductase chaperone
MIVSEPIVQASNRSTCYSLLAHCFQPPERDQLMADGICLKMAECLKNLDLEAAADQAAIMHQQLASAKGIELKIEHAALFVGPFELKAHPYGSVYLEEGRRLMGDTTMKASSFYAASGLQLTISEPADHIAVELEFMHYLSFACSEAIREGACEKERELMARQLRFLEEQLWPWVPDFCAAIKSGSDITFFHALADCLHEFIKADLQLLNQQTVVVS